MVQVSDDEQSRTRRRTILQSLGTASIAGPIFSQVGNASGDNSKTVVTDRSGSDPIRTVEVPNAWYNYERKVDRVREALAIRYDALDSVRANPKVAGLSIGNSEEQIGNYYKSDIRVYVDSNKQKVEVPSEMDGVPIKRITDFPDPKPVSDGCHQKEYTPVPGGVGMSNTGYKSSYRGTTTCKVLNPSGDPGMLTAAHVITGGGDCSSPKGKKAYQSGNQMGKVPSLEYNRAEDWVFINKDGNETNGYYGYIKDANAAQVGYKTEDGLRTLKSNQTTIHKMGQSTCKTEGTVNEVDSYHSSGCFESYYTVICNLLTEKGDSGSPIYHRWYNYDKYRYDLSVIGVTAKSNTNLNLTYGTGAYHLANDHGYDFDP